MINPNKTEMLEGTSAIETTSDEKSGDYFTTELHENEEDILCSRCRELILGFGVSKNNHASLSTFQEIHDADSLLDKLSAEAFDFIARDPRNGYPLSSSGPYIHLVPKGYPIDELEPEIRAVDDNRKFKKNHHLLAIISKTEYDNYHRMVMEETDESPISMFQVVRLTYRDIADLTEEEVNGLFSWIFMNSDGTEDYHILLKSNWEKYFDETNFDEYPEMLAMEDKENGKTGIITHFIHLIDDADLEQIVDFN